MINSYYYIPTDIAIIPMNDGNVLFRSDNLAVRLEGSSVKYLIENIFPMLDGKTHLELVAETKGIEPDELRKNLDQLVKTGVLRARDHPLDEQGFSPNSFTRLMERLNIDPAETDGFFRQTNIAIAGLEGAGAHVAMLLLQTGIGRITLIDPFPLQTEELNLFPFLAKSNVGVPRQEVFRQYFEPIFGEGRVEVAPETLNKEVIYTLTQDCNFIVGCFDKGFISVHHWLNQVAMEKNIPAIFSEIENHLCRIGPLVIPDETACFMCYRMRDIACADNYSETMSYETFINKQKKPELYLRGFLPSSVNFIAGIIANEILKLLLNLETTLASRMMEFNSLNLDTQKHYVLQKPDCPVCLKKKDWIRTHLSLEELIGNGTESNIHSYKEILISSKTGIIKRFDLVPKDPTEPLIPHIFGVTLSNHRFLSKDHGENESCSGKGISIHNAEISALGEAVERYSGACFRKEEIHYSTYNEISTLKFDPKKLVLFSAEQHKNIEFAPFDEDTSIGWSTGWSLVNNCAIEVPAISVFMNYSTQSPAEYICPISSNGLAAGATLLNAILSAALEVVERDAFIISWYNQLPCQRIDPLTHPQREIVDYCKTYNRRGVELQLYHLPTDFPVHVFMGIGYQLSGDDGPCMVVGLGADFDPAVAARGALLEIGQIRPALKQRLRDPKMQKRLSELLADPSLVAVLDDHDLLYASRKSVHAFDFLFKQPLTPFEWYSSPKNSKEGLQALIEFLAKKQSDLIYYNLTPPEMKKLGLYTARVIIPDMQPIHFGEKNIRLNGPRLYNLPHELGLRGAPTLPHKLNKNPHPLA